MASGLIHQENKTGTMDPYYDQMLGKLALSYKMISSDQYVEALNIQGRENSAETPVFLADVFFSQGYLRSEQIGILRQAIDIIASRRKKKRFGPLAVSRGLITNQDLLRALDIKKQLHPNAMKPIGQVLVDMGCMTVDQVQEILELQKKMTVSIPTLEEIAPSHQESPASTSSLFGDSLALNVSQDALIAVVGLPEKPEGVTVEDVLAFLDEKGVTFGRMPEEYLKACLESRDLGVNAFVTARGRKGQPPVSGPATVHFSPRPLEHDRPWERSTVKSGDVLAERTLEQPGIPRVTVFGVGFEEKDQSGSYFMNGSGARLNESRDKITAACDGEPFFFADGAVGVLQEHPVEDPKGQPLTLSVEAHVTIKGVPGPGTEIRCVHLTAPDIEGAVILAEGDVQVEGRIVDSRIIASGTVRAGLIRNSTVSSLGDVVVEHGILDSTIETSCRCVVGNSVIASTVRARRGIEASDAASSDGVTCSLEFGADVVPAIVSGDRAGMKKLEMGISGVVEDLHSIESMIRITEQSIADMTLTRRKTEKELELLRTTVERMEQKSNRQVVTGRNKMELLDREIQATDETIDVLEDDRKDQEHRMASLKKQLQIKMKNYRELKESVERKSSGLAARLEPLPPLAQARIRHEIDAGTVLKGPHAVKILENTLGQVLIREAENPDGTRFIQIVAEDS